MAFKNVSSLFNQAMLIISIQEHMHKVGLFFWRTQTVLEKPMDYIHTQGYCWALNKMTEKIHVNAVIFSFNVTIIGCKPWYFITISFPSKQYIPHEVGLML